MRFLKSSLFWITMVLGIGNTFGQASSWSDFKLTIKFDSSISIAEVNAFYYRMPGNRFDHIKVTKDTVLNQLVLSGHNSYITGVRFPTLMFAYTEVGVDANTGEHFMRTRQFFLFSDGVESYNSTLDFNTVEYSIDKPNVLVDMEQRPNNYKVFQESTNGMATNVHFQYVFLGNELIHINEN